MAEAARQSLVCRPMSVPIGYGSSGFGNLYENLPDAAADPTLQAAWDASYRYFDTSPFYGFGLSELRVDAAERGGARPKGCACGRNRRRRLSVEEELTGELSGHRMTYRFWPLR